MPEIDNSNKNPYDKFNLNTANSSDFITNKSINSNTKAETDTKMNQLIKRVLAMSHDLEIYSLNETSNKKIDATPLSIPPPPAQNNQITQQENINNKTEYVYDPFVQINPNNPINQNRSVKNEMGSGHLSDLLRDFIPNAASSVKEAQKSIPTKNNQNVELGYQYLLNKMPESFKKFVEESRLKNEHNEDLKFYDFFDSEENFKVDDYIGDVYSMFNPTLSDDTNAVNVYEVIHGWENAFAELAHAVPEWRDDLDLNTEQYGFVQQKIDDFMKDDSIEYLEISRKDYPDLELKSSIILTKDNGELGIHTKKHNLDRMPDDFKEFIKFVKEIGEIERMGGTRSIFNNQGKMDPTSTSLIQDFLQKSSKQYTTNFEAKQKQNEWEDAFRKANKETSIGEGGIKIQKMANTVQGSSLLRGVAKREDAISPFVELAANNPILRDHPYLAIGKVFDKSESIQKSRKSNKKVLVTEFMSGKDFTKNESLLMNDPKLRQQFYKQLVTGMKDLHQEGYVHRDLKPANFLCDLNQKIAKVGDPDMLVYVKNAETVEKKVGSTSGTGIYMPPDVHLATSTRNPYVTSEQGKKWDVYSMGLSMLESRIGFDNAYQLMESLYVSRKDPLTFEGNIEGCFELNGLNDLNDKEASLIKRMISYNPEDRPSFAEVLKEMESWER